MMGHLRLKELDDSGPPLKEYQPVALSGCSRFRRWIFPALTVTVILILIITLAASNVKTSNRLWSAEKKVSNLSNVVESLSTSLQNAQETAKEVQRLHFTVENNKDQLTSVSEALKQLSVIDSLSSGLAAVKCSLQHIINNSSVSDGCCPLGWKPLGSNCYFFSMSPLSWNNSRVWCDKHGSHLAILSSDKDWQLVTSQSVPQFYWVGLSDWRIGSWEWVNQTPYTIERRHWRPGQPDNWIHHGLGPGDEDCAHLHSDGRLNDLHCSTRLQFICQKHSSQI